MDVVLTPVGTTGKEWSVKDRLGRSLGTIQKSKALESVEIIPEPTAGLHLIGRQHASLDTAMTAIAQHMHGACTLDSQDWD